MNCHVNSYLKFIIDLLTNQIFSDAVTLNRTTFVTQLITTLQNLEIV